MLAKRICVAIVVLLGVSSAVHLASAQAANAWLYAFQVPLWGTERPWTMGVSPETGSASNAILGHVPPSGTVGEVAVTQAIISVGEQVPLPTYADGSQAQEGEEFWTTQLWLAEFPDASGIVRYLDGDHAVATFNGRQLVSATAQINTGGPSPARRRTSKCW